MITLYLLNAILIGHFMGDYIFQKTIVVPDKQSLLSLLLHSLIYTFVFGVIFFAATYKMYDSSLIFQYIILNGFLHYAVDVISGIIKNQYIKHDYENLGDNGFFPTIGFDQLLHVLILFHTFVLMLN